MERMRQKFQSIASSFLARSMGLSVTTDMLAALAGLFYVIVSTGLLYSYLGTARFGVWAAVFSLTAALAFMDFGLGNAAIGALARASRRRSRTLLRTVVLALALAASLVGLITLGLLLLAINISQYWLWFGLKSAGELPELRSFLLVFAVLLACNFPVNALGQAMKGLQRAWIFNLSRLAGFAGATLGIWMGRENGASLTTLALLSFGVQLAFNLIICGFELLRASRHDGRVRPAYVLKFIRRMMGQGGAFVLFNIARTFGWLLDYLIVARLLGPEAAAALAIMQRMFQVVLIGHSILGAALWPAYAYLASGHEWRKLKLIFLAGFSTTVLCAVAASMLIFSFREVIAGYWLKTSVLSLTLAYGLFAIWNCVEAAGSAFSILLNARGIVMRQALAACIFAATSFALKLWFVPLHGLVGLVGSTLAGYAVGFAVLLFLLRGTRIFQR